MAILASLGPSPPLKTISQSRIALHGARQSMGEILAPDLFYSAERRWENLLSEWNRQNQKWFPARDYQEVFKLAVETRDIAGRCREKSMLAGDSLKIRIPAETAALEKEIRQFKTRIRELPIPEPSRKRYVRAELMILESRSAWQRQDHVRSAGLLKSARTLLGQTGQEVSGRLRAYFSNLTAWREMADETVAWSRINRDAAILVDKLAHQCRIYRDGILAAEFPVELGANWMGHKRMRGDRATPEGRYRVMGKKSDCDTPYHKALQIDYPNREDLLRFEDDKQRGRLPRNADIGGSIEIHGGGGRKADWTNGCIALQNGDMDVLFEWARPGTPVTIIGSLNPGGQPLRF
ncbi:L,D-transpeptidase [bacterium]|nr:L,D-transpeptidase [bacterium]